MKSYDVTIQLKATHREQYFPDLPVLLLFMLHKVVLTFGTVMCSHFNKSFFKLKSTNFHWVLLLLDRQRGRMVSAWNSQS